MQINYVYIVFIGIIFNSTGILTLIRRLPDDLWNVMQTVIDELNPKGYDLTAKQMMDVWTIQKHFPVLNVTRDYSSGRVIISKEFHDKLDQIPYFIPVTYTKETDLDFEN